MSSSIRSNVPRSSKQDVLRQRSSTRTHRTHWPSHGHLPGRHRHGSHVNALLPFLKWAVPRPGPHPRPTLHLRPRGVHFLFLGGRQRQLISGGGWHQITRTGTFLFLYVFEPLLWWSLSLRTNKLRICFKGRIKTWTL